VGSLRELGRADLLRLADALERGKLGPSYADSAVGRYVGNACAADASAELRRLDGLGMSPVHVAYTARLLAEERAVSQAIRDRVDIVWTGPEVEGSLSRDSATVARELLGQAERSVLLASYAIDPKEGKVKGLLGGLADRMDANPELDVQLFINVKRPWKDERAAEVLVAEEAVRLRGLWPGERRPTVYFDPRALDIGHGPRACLHAKVVVVDQKKALVTSANLTEAAHERNIEAGVLIEDADVARTLERQFRSLVEAGALVKMPGVGT
jgi:phosphatidylserine/phosphatidylglycerophosphate/cardiolipin synthase-like enzyme